VCFFWKKHGDTICPQLKPVAQAILGLPPASAVLERDFCIADSVMTRKRGSVDPAYVEMMLFCRANYHLIPSRIPELDAEKVKEAIPTRLTDPSKLSEVAQLDVLPEAGEPGSGSDEGSGSDAGSGSEAD